MPTINRGFQRALCVLALTIAMHAPSAGIEKMLILGGIGLKPLVDTACSEAPSITDDVRLNNSRTQLLRQLLNIEVGLSRARQEAQKAQGISLSLEKALAESVHEVVTIEAALKVARDEESKKKLRDSLATGKARVDKDSDDALEADENLKKAFEGLVSAETKVALRPHYQRAIECIEKRLAALRQGPHIASRPGHLGRCKLEGMEWQTTSQLRLTIVVNKGTTCEQPITGSDGILATDVRLFIPPQNGAAEIKAPTTVVYQPKAGYAGPDRIGLMMQTSQGAKTAVINIKVQ